MLAQPDGIAYQIFDQGIMDKAVDGVPPFDFQSALRLGRLVQALAAHVTHDAHHGEELVASERDAVADRVLAGPEPRGRRHPRPPASA